MNRNFVWIGTIAAFGFAVAVAGVGDASRAVACDKTAKAAAASSDCGKKGAATAASAKAECASKAVKTAAVHSGCTKSAAAAVAAGAGCEKSAATAAAAGAGCEKSAATAAAAGAGCEKSGAAASAKSKEECAKVCNEAKTAALKAAVDDIPYRENKRLVLTGSYACGRCTLEVTETCSPLFKTAEGKVYPMIKSQLTQNLRRADAGNGVEIGSSVKKIDGIKYLEVKSYKSL